MRASAHSASSRSRSPASTAAHAGAEHTNRPGTSNFPSSRCRAAARSGGDHERVPGGKAPPAGPTSAETLTKQPKLDGAAETTAAPWPLQLPGGACRGKKPPAGPAEGRSPRRGSRARAGRGPRAPKASRSSRNLTGQLKLQLLGGHYSCQAGPTSACRTGGRAPGGNRREPAGTGHGARASTDRARATTRQQLPPVPRRLRGCRAQSALGQHPGKMLPIFSRRPCVIHWRGALRRARRGGSRGCRGHVLTFEVALHGVGT